MSIFWGCTIPARFPFIEKATRLALTGLGVDAVDVAGFTCCPETALVRSADEDAYYLTAARNLAVAEREGLPLITPCNGCYSTFKSVLSTLKVDWRRRQAINRRLSKSGLFFRGDIDVWHLVEWLGDDFGPAQNVDLEIADFHRAAELRLQPGGQVPANGGVAWQPGEAVIRQKKQDHEQKRAAQPAPTRSGTRLSAGSHREGFWQNRRWMKSDGVSARCGTYGSIA